MEGQLELNGMMRSILVDWLVEVHIKFRLQQETLYLCVNIIDRYLCNRSVERGHLQLVGVTALLIACKYEEIYPPEVKDCVYITDRAYTRQNVLDMEADIVNALQFKMSVPTGYSFLQRFLHITKAPRSVQDLSNFYMEKMLQEYGMLNYRASLVAASVVCLAWSNPDVIELEDPVPGVVRERTKCMCASCVWQILTRFAQLMRLGSLLTYTGFKVSEIKGVAVHVCAKVRNRNGTSISGATRPLHAVARKYECQRLSRASVAYELPSPCYLRSLQE
jgi:Cyclin, N-terminal domain/Cyclin, C-terminal domain